MHLSCAEPPCNNSTCCQEICQSAVKIFTGWRKAVKFLQNTICTFRDLCGQPFFVKVQSVSRKMRVVRNLLLRSLFSHFSPPCLTFFLFYTVLYIYTFSPLYFTFLLFSTELFILLLFFAVLYFFTFIHSALYFYFSPLCFSISPLCFTFLLFSTVLYIFTFRHSALYF